MDTGDAINTVRLLAAIKLCETAARFHDELALGGDLRTLLDGLEHDSRVFIQVARLGTGDEGEIGLN